MITLDPDLAEFAEFVAFATGRPLAAAPAASAAKIDARLDAQVADSGDVALANADGHKAADLLAASQREGAAVLARVTRSALARWLDRGDVVLHADRLFNDTERAEIADSIAATNVTAELLGRSRIRLRLAKHSEPASKFSANDPTPFEVFADQPLRPLAPEKALEFFRLKVPLPGVVAADLTETMNRLAFTLAVNADAALLERVQAAIQGVLDSGNAVKATPRAITDLLHEAGVTETVGGTQVAGEYSSMLTRTNLMNSYNDGSQQELAEVATEFPWWRFVGIADGRQRPSHAAHFDKYYSSDVPFTSVRDSIDGMFSGFNCRCTMIPIYRSDVEKLQAGGVKLSTI